MLCTWSRNMGNSFEVLQYTLPKPIDQPRSTVFRTRWASCNNGVNAILQKYGKGGGRGGRTSLRQLELYFDARLYIDFSFFVFFVFFRFLFLLHWREQLWIRVEYRITSPVCLCLHLFVQRASVIRSPPKGGRGCLMSSSLSGLSFDSTLLSPLLFFCQVLLPFLSHLFLPAGPFF